MLAATYYHTYIRLVPAGNIVDILAEQLEPSLALFRGISEEHSLHRYAEGKWSLRQALNHISDTERVMGFRAYWFARNFDTPLPGMDQDVAAAAARADDVSWAAHIEEFRTVRQATVTFFRNLPEAAWQRSGTASDSPFDVEALAHICAGHNLHHQNILKTRYLGDTIFAG